MLGQNHFYHETIRRSVIAFGSVFNDIHVRRKDGTGTAIQSLKVLLRMVLSKSFLLDFMRTLILQI